MNKLLDGQSLKLESVITRSIGQKKYGVGNSFWESDLHRLAAGSCSAECSAT